MDNKNEAQYLLKWIELNDKMVEKGFTWGSLEEDEDWHQYMSYGIHTYSQREIDSINIATKKIGNVYNKMYHKLLDGSQESNVWKSELGLPVQTWDAANVPSDLFSYFTRMDFIVNGDEIKLIEVNCDTPTGYIESSIVNQIICEEYEFVSPNKLEENIKRTWAMISKEYNITDYDTVHFTSYGWHDEDRETVLFNLNKSCLHKTKFIAIEDIIVSDEGLFDQEGDKINFLYRLYPLEYLVDDKDSTGNEIGLSFLQHIADGKVKLINPPGSFLMQSKAVLALIWTLRDDSGIFSFEERESIRRYFLPTYLKSGFPFENKAYVAKPIYGREGGSVEIFDNFSKLVEKDEEDYYAEWQKVYQQYVEMPTKTVNTWDGEYTGKMLVGSFLIGGEASGLFLRVGEKITGNLSMFCPVAIEKR
ncbi:glutathionylspermidine synthase [Bacillus sp. Soil768D1]|nr:glutathionylspermidine synthase [Bacillus sp. Soil768D1]